MLVGAHEAVGSYRKTRLVPFGEYVPLRPLFGWITRYSKAAAKDRQRGAGPVVLAVNSLHIAPLISYEMTFSDLTRHAARLGGAAGVSEFHLDVPRELGAAAVGRPARGARRRSRHPSGARQLVGRQLGL